jgi:long-chain acyl-CoA synthetase
VNLTGTSSSQLQAALARLRERSIAELLAERVAEQPDAVAVRFKRGGVFRELTWKTYREEIRRVAAGLLACGLRPGARIAIMGDVTVEYLLLDLAAT